MYSLSLICYTRFATFYCTCTESTDCKPEIKLITPRPQEQLNDTILSMVVKHIDVTCFVLLHITLHKISTVLFHMIMLVDLKAKAIKH